MAQPGSRLQRAQGQAWHNTILNKLYTDQSGPIQSVFLVWSCHQRQMARLELVGDGGWQGSKVSMGTGVKQLLTAHWLSNKKEYE